MTTTKTTAKPPAKTAKPDAKAPSTPPSAKAAKAVLDESPDGARARLAGTGRNDPCPCGSDKKYKKCHLAGDETAATPPPVAPDARAHINEGWRLFEQRRPGAAEKEFRTALAIEDDNIDARVGVGMAKLSAGDTDGARVSLADVAERGEQEAAKLRKEKVKDAFTRKETQVYIRACHALGCLAYDQERFEDGVRDLERVYAIDEGTVGTEARLVAGKTLIKLGRAADSIAVLDVAAKSEGSAGRAQVGLALAHFTAGDQKAAARAFDAALATNGHYGKALLGLSRRTVDNLAGAAPGSREEALVYAQTYGDVWDDKAKAWLGEYLAVPRTGAGASGDDPRPAQAGPAE